MRAPEVRRLVWTLSGAILCFAPYGTTSTAAGSSPASYTILVCTGVELSWDCASTAAESAAGSCKPVEGAQVSSRIGEGLRLLGATDASGRLTVEGPTLKHFQVTAPGYQGLSIDFGGAGGCASNSVHLLVVGLTPRSCPKRGKKI